MIIKRKNRKNLRWQRRMVELNTFPNHLRYLLCADKVFKERPTSQKLLKIWGRAGKHYGFPKCCIKDFLTTHWSQRNPLQNDPEINQSSGFVPCATHAQMIARKEIRLEELIRNRKCKTPFPDDGY